MQHVIVKIPNFKSCNQTKSTERKARINVLNDNCELFIHLINSARHSIYMPLQSTLDITQDGKEIKNGDPNDNSDDVSKI